MLIVGDGCIMIKNERRFIIVQVLKEELRTEIRRAAIMTFKKQGYQKASMREIATVAGMSVGNLYRYYKNKEAIFAEIVQPMIETFQTTQTKSPPMEFEMLDVNFLEHSALVESLIGARINFRDELYLLFLKADGSPFEGAKETLSEFLYGKFTLLLEGVGLRDAYNIDLSLYVKTATAGMVASFCMLLESAETDQQFVVGMLEFMELSVKPSIRNIVAISSNSANFRRISDEEVLKFFSSRVDSSCDSDAEGH